MAAQILVAKNGKCMWWCSEDGSHSPIYSTSALDGPAYTDVERAHAACQTAADSHNRKYHGGVVVKDRD